MSKYLALFVGEATEHLEALARDLVKLEHQPSSETLESMFRHAHSVKGMSASMGFTPTTTLAHRMEDVLDVLRTKKGQADRATVDLLLASTDALLGHVKQAAAAQPFSDVTALQRGLEDALSRMAAGKASSGSAITPPRPSPPVPASAAVASSTPPAAAPEPSAQGALSRYAVRYRVARQSSTPGVRAFLAWKRLSTLGNVFDLKPVLDDLKAGRLPDNAVSLELETQETAAAVEKALGTIADVELVFIKPIDTAAKPSAPVAAAEGPRVVGQEPARTVRIKTELLDQFLDAAGELLLATAQVREVTKAVPTQSRPPLEEAVDRLHSLVRDLHDKVMKARMTPISVVTDRLPRAARDIARRRERDLELTLSGTDVELDRSMVDELADPLLHLLRNAIDHGIELPAERLKAGKSARGRVQVNVRRVKDRVVLEVEDDGRGIDIDKLKTAAVQRGQLSADEARAMSDKDAFMLCCLPGVSTSTDVTDISGRGVGMDAVKRAIESVGGTLEIDSTKGKGTKFVLTLPLTVAVMNLLLVGVGDETFGLPINKVSGVIEAPPSSLSKSQATTLLPFGNALLPVFELAQVLEVPVLPAVDAHLRSFVVVDAENGKVAFGVDTLRGQEEVVLKGLSKPLDLVPGLAGVTILGNGRPIFILDVARLVG